MSENEFIIIVTTTEKREDAIKIAKELVERKLCACAQISGPIFSVYTWEGKLEEAEEWRLLIKTRRTLYKEVEASILRLHSYSVPQIIAVPIQDGLGEYLSWLRDSTS